MRQRKLAISVLLATILVIDAILLGWSLADIETIKITTYVVHIGFDLHTLTWLGTPLRQPRHIISTL